VNLRYGIHPNHPMKAHLRSARIAPKKANLIAKMVRGMTVPAAMTALAHTHKKGARMIEQLLKSAVANAEHNEKQDGSALVIKTIVVNQGTAFRRAIPKARGSVRPIRKFLSHISVTLGVATGDEKNGKLTKKLAQRASQTKKNTVKKTRNSKEQKTEARKTSSESSESSVSSASSESSASSAS
jgi:large subunit ribosomal protein L22